jgi:hypothetical protein
MRSVAKMRRALCTLLVLVAGCAGLARASATLLLEEPYGKLGFFTATGHAAVYLSGVCAETPLVLRPCAPGETGIVISRYNGVGGYDWMAIPLIPYLYAVEQPENVPLYADPRMASFLRDQYRRNHLESVVPDAANGETPGGNWYELVGTAYDRTVYGFEIETTAAQDRAFIARYNSLPNRSHFRTVSRNCADFTKDVINFYYPRALHRSVVADVGITTPKQMAKTLIKFSARHPRLEFSRYVIPQVPGIEARSTPVHGVVESFLKSKKYIVPSVLVSPIFAGCVVAVYVGTGAGRFDPSREAEVFNAERELEAPLGAEDRSSYQLELNHLVASASADMSPARTEKWKHLLRNAAPNLDAEGRPVLRIRKGDEVVTVGVTGSNIFANNDAAESVTEQGAEPIAEAFAQQLLEARLRAELRRGSPPKVSESDITRDWNLLQKAKAMSDADNELAAQGKPQASVQPRTDHVVGNRP